MKIKFFNIKYENSERITNRPTFYKYYIYINKPLVLSDAVLERVFMPWNKKYNTLESVHKFLWSVMSFLGKSISHLYLYYDYLL